MAPQDGTHRDVPTVATKGEQDHPDVSGIAAFAQYRLPAKAPEKAPEQPKAPEVSHDGFFAAALPALARGFNAKWISAGKLYQEVTTSAEETINSATHAVAGVDLISQEHLAAKHQSILNLDNKLTQAETHPVYAKYSAGYWGNAFGEGGGALPYYLAAAMSVKLSPKAWNYIKGAGREEGAVVRAGEEVQGQKVWH